MTAERHFHGKLCECLETADVSNFIETYKVYKTYMCLRVNLASPNTFSITQEEKQKLDELQLGLNSPLELTEDEPEHHDDIPADMHILFKIFEIKQYGFEENFLMVAFKRDRKDIIEALMEIDMAHKQFITHVLIAIFPLIVSHDPMTIIDMFLEMKQMEIHPTLKKWVIDRVTGGDRARNNIIVYLSDCEHDDQQISSKKSIDCSRVLRLFDKITRETLDMSKSSDLCGFVRGGGLAHVFPGRWQLFMRIFSQCMGSDSLHFDVLPVLKDVYAIMVECYRLEVCHFVIDPDDSELDHERCLMMDCIVPECCYIYDERAKTRNTGRSKQWGGECPMSNKVALVKRMQMFDREETFKDAMQHARGTFRGDFKWYSVMNYIETQPPLKRKKSARSIT